MERNDIYLCTCCLDFFSELTDERVDVPYSEMPVEFAIDLMQGRAELVKKHHKAKRAKRGQGRKPGNGFSMG